MAIYCAGHRIKIQQMEKKQRYTLIKKYRSGILLIMMFIFSIHVNAVFEGRNEKLQEYTTIRNSINIEPLDASRKATASGITMPDRTLDDHTTAPVSDSPFMFLLFGGLMCGIYVFAGKKKLKTHRSD